MRHQGGESYQLDLTAQPADVPPMVRLRHVLKGLLRSYGFRCTAVRDTTPYPDGKPPLPTADGAGGPGER